MLAYANEGYKMTTTTLEVTNTEIKRNFSNPNVKPRLFFCIDLDGCVVSYKFSDLVKKYFNVDIKEEDIYAHDLPDTLGVSSKEVDFMFHEQVWGKPNLIEGAIPVLKAWWSKGHHLIIYSNRVKYMGIDGLERWLRQYEIPFSDIVTENTFMYDFAIDDRPRKLEDIDSKERILFNQPWNRKCWNIKGNLTRVFNWQEIEDIVKERI